MQEMYIRRDLFIIRTIFAGIRKTAPPDFSITNLIFAKITADFSNKCHD